MTLVKMKKTPCHQRRSQRRQDQGGRGKIRQELLVSVLYWRLGVIKYWRLGVIKYWRLGVIRYWWVLHVCYWQVVPVCLCLSEESDLSIINNHNVINCSNMPHFALHVPETAVYDLTASDTWRSLYEEAKSKGSSTTWYDFQWMKCQEGSFSK